VKKPGTPAIVIDTREQRPYRFEPFVLSTLDTGDYSVTGYEDRFAIERKSKEDLYSSLGQGRERFEREVARLGRLDYGAIVVESSLSGLLCPPGFTQMNPRAAVCSLLAWSVKHGVQVFFADDRAHGQALTRKILQYAFKYRGGVAP
jgi:ERCC4-type nuclease